MTVAAVENQPVGVIQAVEDFISGLWVHPTCHRRGIGTQLLRAGEDELRKMGRTKVWLPCSCWNSVAPQFYRNRGYEEARMDVEVLPCGIEDKMIIFEKML